MTGYNLTLNISTHGGDSYTLENPRSETAYDQIIHGQDVCVCGPIEGEYPYLYEQHIPYSQIILVIVERSSETVEDPEDAFCNEEGGA